MPWRPVFTRHVGERLTYLLGEKDNELGCRVRVAYGVSSQLVSCREPFSHDFVKHAALLLTRCIPQALDLLYVQSLTYQRYAFLSFGWGIIADIDIESEKFRKLGENRFTVGALQRVLGRFLWL